MSARHWTAQDGKIGTAREVAMGVYEDFAPALVGQVYCRNLGREDWWLAFVDWTPTDGVSNVMTLQAPVEFGPWEPSPEREGAERRTATVKLESRGVVFHDGPIDAEGMTVRVPRSAA